MTLGANIKHLMDSSEGTSYGKLAEFCGTDPQAIQSLVSRNSRRSIFASKLAKYFKIPVELLIDGSPEQISHHLFTERSKDTLTTEGDLPLPASKADQQPPVFAAHIAQESSPVYLAAVPVAGVVTTGSGELHKMTDIADSENIKWPSSDQDAYALRIHGEHLSPRARHGEYMIIEPNVPAGPGDEVVIKRFDHDDLLIGQLLYYRDGMAYLEDLNGRGQRISVEQNSIRSMHQIGGFAKSTLRTSS